MRRLVGYLCLLAAGLIIGVTMWFRGYEHGFGDERLAQRIREGLRK